MADTGRPDKELIQAYLDGDAAAFEHLHERYRRPLYSYLNKMMPGQAATVDDVYQQTWIKAIDNLERYEHRQQFFAWLVRIARNTAIDHWRRQRPTEDVSEMPLGSEDPPWRRLKNRELGEAIANAVAQLPPEQREVFLLRQDDVPFKEIAAIQDCSINTALGRMHYAVNKLREMLQDWR